LAARAYVNGVYDRRLSRTVIPHEEGGLANGDDDIVKIVPVYQTKLPEGDHEDTSRDSLVFIY